ncbi:MAG TPA: AMP-binding protein [Acidobacteriota bacterium]
MRRRLLDDPQEELCRLIFADGPEAAFSTQDFLRRSTAYCRFFRTHSSRQQQLVCVCLYHSLDLLAAFTGAFLAGQIPSMVAPPSPRMEPQKYRLSFRRILEHLRPEYFVTEQPVLQSLGGLAGSIDCRLVSTNEISSMTDAELTAHWAEPSPDAVVLLQHSSGTTGLQKGVALSHRAVLAQIGHYAGVLGLTGQDRIVSWLPLYHDMGLIACFLLPLLWQVPFVQISPFDWVTRPMMLFEALHRCRGTLCFLPNFAYEFLAAGIRLSQMEGFSLQSVRGFINCSEPVSAATHRRFHARFKDAGVHPEKLWSCYAMAENVFAVTQSEPAASLKVERVDRDVFIASHKAEEIDSSSRERPVREFVSCGRPIPGTLVEVRDPSGRKCAERTVGEICIRGDSLFTGYYGRDDLTCEAFWEDHWYRTGDLGYLSGGELYVTGRKKDLIIVQGRNFYPGDIEAIVSATPGIVPGRAVAFGLMDERTGTEKIVVLAETNVSLPEELEKIQLAVRTEVAQQLDCTIGDLHLLPERWLVKSTSGKIARPDNKEKFIRELMPGPEPRA